MPKPPIWVHGSSFAGSGHLRRLDPVPDAVLFQYFPGRDHPNVEVELMQDAVKVLVKQRVPGR